jgi:hypothetical protein
MAQLNSTAILVPFAVHSFQNISQNLHLIIRSVCFRACDVQQTGSVAPCKVFLTLYRFLRQFLYIIKTIALMEFSSYLFLKALAIKEDLMFSIHLITRTSN